MSAALQVSTEPGAAQNFGARQSLELQPTHNTAIVSHLPRLSQSRLAEAERRRKVLNQFEALVSNGASGKEAARLVNESVSTIWRYQKKFKELGFNGLLPDTDKCGRKSALAKLGITVDGLAALLQQCQGLNLDLNSDIATLRSFAQTDYCPEALAAVILQKRTSKHAVPPSIRRAVKINANLEKAHRGPRTLNLKGLWIPRRLDILPGDVFSSDDTTAIWGCWVPWETSDEYPFGVKLMQVQHLPVIDVASQAVITYGLICRETSSYRASDIWGLFGHTFDTVGLPRLGWQLERGTWEAAQIAGKAVEVQEGEVSWGRRVGGLRQLPTNVTAWHRQTMGDGFPKTLQTFTSYLPKSKSIEAFFDRSQTFEGTLWGCLGRDQMRAPMERAKKLFEQCSRLGAKEDPRQHFLSLSEICTRLNAIYEHLNNEPMEGEVFSGIPWQKFENARREHPLFLLPEDQRWLYRGAWKELTITSGWARVRLTHPVTGERFSHFYTNARMFAGMEGARVMVYYDRERFDQPAQILAASDFVNSSDGQRYRPGDYVCSADYFERRGMFLDGDQSGHDLRKAWRNAVMSAYGTIVRHAPSRAVPPEITQRLTEADLERRENLRPRFTLLSDVPQVNLRFRLVSDFCADVHTHLVNRHLDRIFTRDLLMALDKVGPTASWDALRHGAIDERWLAGIMAELGVRPRTVRIGDRIARGYLLADVDAACAARVQASCATAADPKPPSEST